MRKEALKSENNVLQRLWNWILEQGSQKKPRGDTRGREDSWEAAKSWRKRWLRAIEPVGLKSQNQRFGKLVKGFIKTNTQGSKWTEARRTEGNITIEIICWWEKCERETRMGAKIFSGNILRTKGQEGTWAPRNGNRFWKIHLNQAKGQEPKVVVCHRAEELKVQWGKNLPGSSAQGTKKVLVAVAEKVL